MNTNSLMFLSISGFLIFCVILYLIYLAFKDSGESIVNNESEFNLSLIAARGIPSFVGTLSPKDLKLK